MSEPSYLATVEARQSTAAVVEQIVGVATVRTERVTATAVATIVRAVATAAAAQGIAGPPGKRGERGIDGGRAIEGIAAQALGGHRVVRAAADGIRYASVDDAASAGTVLGITIGAVDAGAEADILAIGPMTEPSWSWALGPIFCGLDGGLTQVPPLGVFEQQVATAIAANRILVRIDPHVILAQRT